MKNINQFKKFQFFDVEKQESDIKGNKSTSVSYKMTDITPIRMKVFEKIVFMNVYINKFKDINNDKTKENKEKSFRLVKVINNVLIDEYILFNDTLINFEFRKYQDKVLLIALGTDLVGAGATVKNSLNKSDENQPLITPTEGSIPLIKVFDFTKFITSTNSDLSGQDTSMKMKNPENKMHAPVPVPVLHMYLLKSRQKDKNKEQKEDIFTVSSIDENTLITHEGITGIRYFAVSKDLTSIAISLNNDRIVQIKVEKKENIALATEPKDRKVSLIKIPDKKRATNIIITPYNGQNTLIFTTMENIYYKKIADKDHEINLIGADLEEHKGASETNLGIGNMNNFIIATYKQSYIEEYMDFERGRSWFFDKKKKFLQFFKDYLLFVLCEEGNTKDKNPVLCVYDSQNNIFIYYDESKPIIVLDIYTTSDRIYVLAEDNSKKDSSKDKDSSKKAENDEPNKTRKMILCLKEKDNKDKFDAFYRKSFFDTAYTYAKSLKYDNKKISEISKLHAEFLFKKNEFDKSIDQYKLTINYLDPSYVIQRFLDGSKLNYLIEYLEALQRNDEFKRNCAPERLKDFTALLLNCYIKQKQIQKLKVFVLDKDIDENSVKTAIEVCKDSSKISIAKGIAKEKKMTELYVQILMDNKNDYAECIDEIQKNCDNVLTQFNILVKYGEKFINNVPKTTDLITSVICKIIDYKNGNEDVLSTGNYTEEQKNELKKLKYQKIISVFAGDKNRDKLEKFLDTVMDREKKYSEMRKMEKYAPSSSANTNSGGPKTINFSLETLEGLGVLNNTNSINDTNNNELEINTSKAVETKKKKKNEKEEKGCPSEIILKKIELLLNKSSSYNKTKEISQILETYKEQIDKNYLMLLFKETGYDEGINLLFKDDDSQEKFQEILNSNNNNEETDENAIKVLSEDSSKGTNNWLQILTHNISQGAMDSAKEKNLINILRVLEKSGEVSPLTVLNLLGVKKPGKKIPFRIIKDYLIHWIRKQKESLKEDQRVTEENYEKILNNEAELKDLQRKGRPLKNPKCVMCGYALDFPFVYFGCEHGFHQSCYNNEATDSDEPECPKCKQKNVQCTTRINDGKSAAHNENQFKTDLKQKAKKKKFDFICEYLGKGVFGQEEEEQKKEDEEKEEDKQNTNNIVEDDYGMGGIY